MQNAPGTRLTPAHRLAGVLLLGLSGALYLYALDRIPPYLSLDEAHFGVHAYAIAHTGRNLNGDLMPLFVSLADPLGDRPELPWGNTWYHPVLFYLIALALKVLPLTEASIRVPTALMGGVVNVALMYAVALRVMGNRWHAGMAALMLALCPAHLILSRQAVDYVAPVPFILGWLWCLLVFARTGRVRYACAGGLVLGAGCYSYVTSWVMMPLYLVLSWVVVRSHPNRATAWRWSTTGFALPLLLLVPWLWLHPEMARNIRDQYRVPDTAAASVTPAVEGGVHAGDAARIALSTYWDYFNPSFLFVMGGASRSVSTGQAGVFLLPLAVWLPFGLHALWRRPDMRWLSLVLLVGLATAPILAAMKGAPYATQRVTGLLPFAILISALGWSSLWQSQHRWVRVVAGLLVAAMAAQFAGFYRDYHSGYRVRSAPAYDPTAFRDAAQQLLDLEAAGSVPTFYLTAPLYDVSAKWRFYATQRGREDLLLRTRYFDGNLEALHDAEPGSVAVVPADEPRMAPATRMGTWTVDRTIADLAGRATLVVLRRGQWQ